MPFAAVREVAEETGLDVHLGPMLGDVSYAVPEGRKVVRYWSARVAKDNGFTARRRGRRAALDPRRAGRRAAHLRPRPGRAAALRGPRPPHVDDPAGAARQGGQPQPVGRRRRRAAAVVVGPGAGASTSPRCCRCSGPERIVSAPPLRCRDTVAPLADGARPAGRRRAAAGRGAATGSGRAQAWRACASSPPRPGVTAVASQGGRDPGRRARAGAELAAPAAGRPVRRAVPQGEHVGARLRGVGAALGRLLLAPDGLSALLLRPSCAPGPWPAPWRPSCPSWPPRALASFGLLCRGGLRGPSWRAAAFAGRLGAPWRALVAVALAGFAVARLRGARRAPRHRGRARPGCGGAGGGALAPPPTAVLNPVPGRNAGTVAAGTATVWPVRGLRPTRAARARPRRRRSR